MRTIESSQDSTTGNSHLLQESSGLKKRSIPDYNVAVMEETRVQASMTSTTRPQHRAIPAAGGMN